MKKEKLDLMDLGKLDIQPLNDATLTSIVGGCYDSCSCPACSDGGDPGGPCSLWACSGGTELD